MKTSNTDLVLFGIFCVVLVGGLLISGLWANPNNSRLDSCIAAANQIGIDPNDEQRSTFIRNCYER